MITEFVRARGNRADFLDRMASTPGDVLRFRLLSDVFFLVKDPLVAREVLVSSHVSYDKGIGLAHAADLFGNGQLTSSGDCWKQQRRATRSILGVHDIEKTVTTSVLLAGNLADNWADSSLGGDVIDIASDLRILTLRIFFGSVCQKDLSRQRLLELDSALTTIATDTARRMAPPGSVFATAFRVGRRRRTDAVRFVHELVNDELDRYRLSAESESPLARLIAGLGTSQEERRDQIATLLIASSETTSAALFWVLYLLSRNKSVEDLVCREVEALGDFSFQELQTLEHTKTVVAESLRLFPPVWVIPRRSNRPVRLGSFDLPLGANVLISPYLFHRDKSCWVDASVFQPGRFARQVPWDHYLPFGLGPRRCAGSHLAHAEMLAVLAVLLRRFRFDSVGRATARPVPLLTLRPPKSVRFTLQTR